MLRFLTVAFVCFASSVAAQPENEVEAARQDYIAGNYAAALAVLQPAADAGNAVAQNIVGVAYLDGNGVAQSTERALEWYEKAAAQNNVKALHNLGALYSEGLFLEIDTARAEGYFQRAVDLDYAPSFSNLGLLFAAKGPKGQAEAVRIFTEGAAKGGTWSAFNLGNAYRSGEGVAQDYAKARQMYARGIELGHAPSYNAYGLMAQYGWGGDVDLTTAFIMLREGVARGHALAGINLAFFMTEQDTVWQDPVGGYAYCLWGIQRAGASERDGFIEECEGLVEYLSVEEEDEAQRIAEGL